MTKLNRSLAVAIALALSGSGIAYCLADTAAPGPNASAQTPKAADQGPTQVTETYIGGPTEKDNQEMSDAALAAARAMHLARDALNDGYTDQAKKLLTDAHELLEKAKAEDKPMTVSQEVKVGDKEVKSEKSTVTPDLIPIISHLQIIEEVAPTPAKMEAIGKAKGHLGKGEREQAIAVLKAAEVGLASEDISLPLADTSARVEQALKLTDAGKYYEANLELKKAQDGLVRETTVLMRPTAPPPDQAKSTAVKGKPTK